MWRCLYSGQMDGFALGLEALALVCAVGQRPVASGASSSVAALLKPQVLWLLPAAPFIFLIRTQQGRRFAADVMAGCSLLVGMPALIDPQLLLGGARSLVYFTSSIPSIQPDLAGLGWQGCASTMSALPAEPCCYRPGSISRWSAAGSAIAASG